ncbi:MAG: DUF975 family protein [Paludibacter sp.]|nr:DUF975 family protein [Paludibacter sp.]
MTTENRKLMQMARESLDQKWGLCIGTYLVYLLIMGGLGTIPVAPLIVGGPFALGVAMFTLSVSRKEESRIEQIFHGFEYFGNSLVAYLLMTLFILLWSLLLIVPGIIAAFSYSMTFFIMADDPTIGPVAALEKSKKMMNGYKWKLFCLNLRFIGWFILCLLTLGLGFLFLTPYVYVSHAKFYEDLKANEQTSEPVA